MNSRTRVASISLLACGLAICLMPSMSLGEEALKATPEQVYNKYHQAMIHAKSFEDVTPFLVQKRVKQMKDTPAADRTMMFGLMQDLCPKDVHIVSAKIDGTKADLKLVVGDGKPVITDSPLIGKVKEETKGEVNMVVEDGEWKIEKESWNSSSVSADSTPPPADAPKNN